MADSILRHGLQQFPVGRPLDPESLKDSPNSLMIRAQNTSYKIKHAGYQVQLAYGHTRLAAYKLLVEQGHQKYQRMPVVVRELTDQQLYEIFIAENHDRKDLDPIQTARLMAVYRDQFGKTSAEIGELFHKGDSAVRNLMRLLELPEAVKEQISAGKLTETMARKLLTMQRIAPEAVAETAKTLASGGYETPEAVRDYVNIQFNRANTFTMWNRYNQGEPHAGVGLWPLDWDPAQAVSVRSAQVYKVFPETKEHHVKVIDELLVAASTGINTPGLVKLYRAPERLAEQISLLVSPPACTRCPFYAKLDGYHYCGVKECWKAKKKMWQDHQLKRMARELGIPIYDPERDGKHFEEASRRDGKWGENGWEACDTEYPAWIETKADHLRLRANYNEYREHEFTKSHIVQIISVRQEVAQEKAQEVQKRQEEHEQSKLREDNAVENRRKRELSIAWMREFAAVFFAQPFQALNLIVVEDMVRARVSGYELEREDIPEDPNAHHVFFCRYLAFTVINASIRYNDEIRGPVHVAGLLRQKLVTWGIPVPPGWEESAKSFEGVEVEP